MELQWHKDKMMRKAVFFTIDVLIALSFLVVGFLFVYSAYLKEPPASQTFYYSNDLINFFSGTRISQFDDVDIYTMWCDRCEGATHDIQNPENTILEQILAFVYFNRTASAEALAKNASEGIIREQFFYRMNITLGSRSWLLADSMSNLNISRLVLASNDVSYILLNSSEIAGPFVTRVEVWI